MQLPRGREEEILLEWGRAAPAGASAGKAEPIRYRAAGVVAVTSSALLIAAVPRQRFHPFIWGARSRCDRTRVGLSMLLREAMVDHEEALSIRRPWRKSVTCQPFKIP